MFAPTGFLERCCITNKSKTIYYEVNGCGMANRMIEFQKQLEERMFSLQLGFWGLLPVKKIAMRIDIKLLV